ncbi:MAG: Sulfide-quinone reductase [Holosporales bacterium]
MAHIVIIGAGLGGCIMAYEMQTKLGPTDKLTVVNKGSLYQFTPSNPWVAVGWRERHEIEVDLTIPMAKKHIHLETCPAKRVHPKMNQVELDDGRILDYDYLIIATGPKLACDEIKGLGPNGFTASICTAHHAQEALKQIEALIQKPGPVIIGAAQGASCFGPAYEFVMILDTKLKKAGVRHKVPITFVTPEPYIGHLGIDGVGDTKSLLEHEMRQRDIKWITNVKIKEVEKEMMHVEEMDNIGGHKMAHTLPFSFSMILPAFKGVDAIFGIEDLVNPRGFVLINEHQQNPTYKNVFGVGVCVAIPPVGKTPVPVGVPKTGFMIESMVSATASNIAAMMKNEQVLPDIPTWNAVCLADFGNRGVAFIAKPQLPPRNVNWSSEGMWVHFAKVAFEKYFLHKIAHGHNLPFYEKFALELMGLTHTE